MHTLFSIKSAHSVYYTIKSERVQLLWDKSSEVWDAASWIMLFQYSLLYSMHLFVHIFNF